MTTTPVEPAGLAAALRTGTQEAHDAAEHTTFVTDMVGGRLDVDAVADYHAQLWFVYDALEECAEKMRGTAVAGGFVDPALHRAGPLAKDLERLLGADWSDKVQAGPATQKYVARIREVCATSEEAFVAHHYTRYLGDLSGGRSVGAMIARHYGLEDLAFYDFPEIPEPVPYKREYRDRLNAAPWDEETIARAVDEAKVAFALNTAVFVELAERHPASAGE